VPETIPLPKITGKQIVVDFCYLFSNYNENEDIKSHYTLDLNYSENEHERISLF
jgi:hypothetical protein